MSILRSSLCIPTSTQNFSSLTSISGRTQIHFLTPNLPHLHLTATNLRFETMKIRMGGGPRTYPGGVSKWQWKRMQSNKAKQLLKARLARERQIYEMRKRAELKAAVSELERPWEVVQKAPNLFSVAADEQLKVLADRFQRPGGFDMWSDRDGPELFKSSDGVPSARFFPKGVVHSIKPYGKIENAEKSSAKPKRRNHSQAHMNAEAQRHVVDKNRGNSVNGKYLADSSEINRNEVAGGEIRQNRIAENGKNDRNRYLSNSSEAGKSRDQRTRYSSYKSEVGYRSDNENAAIGHDLGIMRSRSRQNNYRYASNSAEGGESREQNYNTRYSGYTGEVGYRTRNNYRYASNSTEGGESREQNYNTRHSGSTAEVGYRIRHGDKGNDLGAMRSRNRKQNYRYSSNSAESGYRTDNSENRNDLGVVRNRSRQNNYRNNRFSSNSAEGGESREQNHQMRYSQNTAKAGYRTAGRNLGSMQNAREGRRVNRIGMKKDLNLDVYDMSVQQDGTYEFQAED